MSALMEVMQMNRASIYATYGSKEALFQKAVERYAQGPCRLFGSCAELTTTQLVIKCIRLQAANMRAETYHPAELSGHTRRIGLWH